MLSVPLTPSKTIKVVQLKIQLKTQVVSNCRDEQKSVNSCQSQSFHLKGRQHSVAVVVTPR